ncbi:MAG: hypothetical protein Q8L85_06165 [Alphaproteobacteria bacterium]|nr:hypothetical protein [Alphaproteobacteria bacterium]
MRKNLICLSAIIFLNIFTINIFSVTDVNAAPVIIKKNIITDFFGTRIVFKQGQQEIEASICDLEQHVNDYALQEEKNVNTDLNFVNKYKELILNKIYYQSYENANNMGKTLLTDVHQAPYYLAQRLENDLSDIFNKNFKKIIGTTFGLQQKIIQLANAMAKLGNTRFKDKISEHQQSLRNREFCDEGFLQRIIWEDNLLLDLLVSSLERCDELLEAFDLKK